VEGGIQALSQEQEDFLLAQAIAASEEEARGNPPPRARQNANPGRSCQLS